MARVAATEGGTDVKLPGRATSEFLTWTVVAVFAVTALALQLRAYPNHDVAWVLWGTREMLGGAVWGSDIIEPNPPLAWYLSMPAVWLSSVLGTPIVPTFQVFVACIALGSIVIFDNITRPMRQDTENAQQLPTLVAASFLLILPYRDFGQREHLMLIASLPYLGLCARRFGHYGPISQIGTILIGVAAGLGFALKPYFLAVPFFVEVLGIFIRPHWKSPFRLETIALGTVVILYAGSIMIMAKEYMTTVVPLVRAIYWSFDLPTAKLVWTASLALVATALAGLIGPKSSNKLSLVFCFATAGFAFSYFVQQKGYSYHLLPVTAGAAIAVAGAISKKEVSPALRIAATLLLTSVLLNPSFATIKWLRLHGPGGASAERQLSVINAIERHAGDGRFLVIAVHPYPAFPTALYTRAKHVSRTNSQWFLPAVNQLRNRRVSPVPNAVEIAETNAWEFVLHDISHAPDLVILDTNAARHTMGRRDFDILSFYKEDARFRAAWAPYKEVKSVATYRFFVREKEQSQ